jgi:hypothetical protein
MTSPSQSKNNVISLKWFKGERDKKAREDFEKILRNDGIVLGRLRDIIDELRAEVERQETSIEDFDSPSWALKQASRLGEKRGLNKVRDLLTFLDGE